MSHLIISKKNEVYLQVKAEPHVYYELADQFTFDVPGAKFMPQYRNKYWDGKIRLFNTQVEREVVVGRQVEVIRRGELQAAGFIQVDGGCQKPGFPLIV